MAFPPSHSFTFHTHEEDQHHLPSTSLNAFPSLPPQHFQGGAPPLMLKRSMSFSGIENKCNEVNGDDELSDDGNFQCGEKKKKLNLEQLQAVKSRGWCLKKETEGSWSNGSDNSSDINLELSRAPIMNNATSCQAPFSTSITQILQYSSKPDFHEDDFCHVIHNIVAQQNFWPWSGQQNHHFH